MATFDTPVTLVASASLPTRFGEFDIGIFEVEGAPTETLAVTRGAITPLEPPLVRLHSECLTGDVLGSLRCDCGEQLDASLELMAQEPSAILLYLRQEGRGIGLANKIRAYALQDRGLDTVDANLALGLPVDRREYRSAAQILRHLGATRVRLLTNNPLKERALEQYGVRVVERVPLVMAPNTVNHAYRGTTANRMGHLLAFEG